MFDSRADRGVDSPKKGWLQPAAWALFLLIIAVAVWWLWQRYFDNSLPKSDDVVRMTMQGFLDGDQYRREIEVPQQHWDDILAALSPAEPDASPSKWQVLGGIEIQTEQDRNCMVELFDLPDEPIGAFAVWTRSFESRTYYRGGNSAKLKEALRKVYAEAEHD